MKATDLVMMFEKEWITKYPDLKYFTTSAVITDILYWAKDTSATSTERNSLLSFLALYLQENSSRFQHTGMNGFRVISDKK